MTLIALVLVIILSALIIKIGAIALRMTGIDKEYANFQALSAFSGTGFTTTEAENIVNHPQRRRVIKVLMILGNIGIISAISTLIISFRGGTLSESATKLAVLGITVIAILIFSLARGFENVLSSFIEKRLSKMTHFSMGTFSEMIRLASGYGIAEIRISDDHKLAGKQLYESSLTQSNILVLAIKRGFHLIATPKADESIQPGDRLVCFGNLKNISEVAA